MPSIYVTNNQEEALTMSNRIAVIGQGLVEQAGGPEGDLRGARHRVRGRLPRRVEPHGCVRAPVGNGGCRVRLGEFELVAGQGEEDTRGPARITIRPERVDLEPRGTIGVNRILGMVERVVYVGSVLQLIVHPASGQTIQPWQQDEGDGTVQVSGSPVKVHIPREALRVLPAGGTAVIERGELEDA